YQSIWVTAGTRWLGTTTTCSPLASVKLSAPKRCAAAGDARPMIAESSAKHTTAARRGDKPARPCPSPALREREGPSPEGWEGEGLMPVEFELVTPERLIVSTAVDMVVVPGTEGNFGVLPGHSPLISTIRPRTVDLYQSREITER